MAGEEEIRRELVAREAGSGLVERLAERIGAAVNASVVFGAAVKRGDVKVIPVARARWAFGGGAGDGPEGSGSGGGGGAVVTPIGYIEVREDGAEFKPIRDRRWIALAGGAIGLAGIAAVRVLGKR